MLIYHIYQQYYISYNGVIEFYDCSVKYGWCINYCTVDDISITLEITIVISLYPLGFIPLVLYFKDSLLESLGGRTIKLRTQVVQKSTKIIQAFPVDGWSCGKSRLVQDFAVPSTKAPVRRVPPSSFSLPLPVWLSPLPTRRATGQWGDGMHDHRIQKICCVWKLGTPLAILMGRMMKNWSSRSLWLWLT